MSDPLSDIRAKLRDKLAPVAKQSADDIATLETVVSGLEKLGGDTTEVRSVLDGLKRSHKAFNEAMGITE